MRIPQPLMVFASSAVTSIAFAFLQDTIQIMIPWLGVMLSVVLCDLAAGLRKSHLLGVHISISLAARETMGKAVVYVGFVMMVAMIDAATAHSFSIAKWGCLLVCALEGGSIISNLLRPHGVDISLKEIVKLFGKKVGRLTDTEADKMMKERNLDKLREIEQDRWRRRDKHQYGANVEKTKRRRK